MFRFVLAQFLLTSLSLMVASRAQAQVKAKEQKNFFMRVTSPDEMQRFGRGTNCFVTGLLRSPDSEEDVATYILRLRAFRPSTQGFIIASEATVRGAKAITLKKRGNEEHLYALQATVKLPGDPGEYLLRVDCFDKEFRVLASQSLFLQVVSAERQHTVSIGSPKASDKYSSKTSIDVTGTSTAKSVVKIRLRLVVSGVTYGETTVNVLMGGAWSGTLNPPMGGCVLVRGSSGIVEPGFV
ncbi:MAG: hypothetical protein FJ271_03005 [Planctomycetes bacterium]|nr:hypothetical protein [Planctomycetota bacterium]